jgi:putative N-acetylmannosamine-6-phosphate epimerase
LWEDGYSARTGGAKVIAGVICKYTQHHRSEKESGFQFNLLEALEVIMVIEGFNSYPVPAGHPGVSREILP